MSNAEHHNNNHNNVSPSLPRITFPLRSSSAESTQIIISQVFVTENTLLFKYFGLTNLPLAIRMSLLFLIFFF